MRGTDSQVYCDNTNRLRLELLVHVLDLCKWSSSCCRKLVVLGWYDLRLMFRSLYFQKTVVWAGGLRLPLLYGNLPICVLSLVADS